MELIEERLTQQKVDRTLVRVKAIKGFYTHFMVYLLNNSVLLGVNYWMDTNGYFGLNHYGIGYWIAPLAWGIGLIMHYIYVFKLSKWEDRKIKDLMNKETFVE
ncbi:2TM domain-containing protein [Spongiivirga citrea]|uniref:2TM domain-containing protein n=1 Tax=Spongiivirga citrea TaxID=1481457 RepID=A0A6M0CIB5_9FLAO|nr:2TM domain-containing protein [Spongiivirga citrea]NER17706.1 hypothetical protein [Spongiivirga citrea]